MPGTEREWGGREMGEVSRSQIWKGLVAHNKGIVLYFILPEENRAALYSCIGCGLYSPAKKSEEANLVP